MSRLKHFEYMKTNTFVIKIMALFLVQYIFGAYYNASFNVALWDQDYKGISIAVSSLAIFIIAMTTLFTTKTKGE